MSKTTREELEAVPTTGAAVPAPPPFAGKPVIVLSAMGPMKETSELPRDADAERVDIARLHPGAKQAWVDGGHAIALEKPEAVVAAVHEVPAAARANAVPRGGR